MAMIDDPATVRMATEFTGRSTIDSLLPDRSIDDDDPATVRPAEFTWRFTMIRVCSK